MYFFVRVSLSVIYLFFIILIINICKWRRYRKYEPTVYYWYCIHFMNFFKDSHILYSSYIKNMSKWNMENIKANKKIIKKSQYCFLSDHTSMAMSIQLGNILFLYCILIFSFNCILEFLSASYANHCVNLHQFE